jgi:hypothetical protein
MRRNHKRTGVCMLGALGPGRGGGGGGEDWQGGRGAFFLWRYLISPIATMRGDNMERPRPKTQKIIGTFFREQLQKLCVRTCVRPPPQRGRRGTTDRCCVEITGDQTTTFQQVAPFEHFVVISLQARASQHPCRTTPIFALGLGFLGDLFQAKFHENKRHDVQMIRLFAVLRMC